MERRKPQYVWYWQSGSLFFGMVLLLIGGFYLAKNQGWIPADFPFWPLILIMLGFILILGGLRKTQTY